MDSNYPSFGGLDDAQQDPLDLNDYVLGVPSKPPATARLTDPPAAAPMQPPFPGMAFDGSAFTPPSAASSGTPSFDPALHAAPMSAALHPGSAEAPFLPASAPEAASASMSGVAMAPGPSPDRDRAAYDADADEGGDGDESKDGVASKEGESADTIPPWSEMKTKAGKDRKRLPLACIACRRKKIRCSGEKPACKHCLRSRIPCVYKVTTRKAAPRTDYMAMLDKRLKRMEDRVIRLIPKDNMGTVGSVGRAVVKPALPAPSSKAANSKKRVAEEAFGASLDEWANSGTAHPNAGPQGPHDGEMNSEEEESLLTEGAESLPPTEIQEHLAEVYFDYIYGQTYHLLHKPSYMRRLASNNLPPVLILAVCATSARFSSHPQVRSDPAFLRGDDWARVAEEISLKRFDKPSITILIVYLLLGLHGFGTCQGGRSWMFCGMAQRMAYALQLHKDLEKGTFGRPNEGEEDLSFIDREIRRRTMWSCFLMDRFTSSGTDRPMFIDERHLKLQLPVRENYFLMEISGPTEDLSGGIPHPVGCDSGKPTDAQANMGVAAYIIRLVAIWGRIIKYVNLGGKARDDRPMWSPESRFQELHSQILEFKNTLPESLRYNQDNFQSHAMQKTANQFIFLHIAYHQVLLFLHRFALPLGTPLTLDDAHMTASTSGEQPQQFIAEAARTAIEAANQISNLIKDAWEYRVVAPFAGYSAFFASTVHIQGIFSKNAMVESSAKQNLAYNVRYLTRMKKHWGMFHFVAENLKELYRQHADAASKNTLVASNATLSTPATLSSRLSPGTSDVSMDDESPMSRPPIFQYGDWFDHYPNGVSKTDYEDPAAKRDQEAGTDSVMSHKSDLQSVEEFFASLATPSQAEQGPTKPGQRKAQKKSRHAKAASAPNAKDAETPAAGQPPAPAAARGRPRQGTHDETKSRRPQPVRSATDRGKMLQPAIHTLDTNVSPNSFQPSPGSVNMFSSPIDPSHPHSAHPLSQPAGQPPHQQPPPPQPHDPFSPYVGHPRPPHQPPPQQPNPMFSLSNPPVDEAGYWPFDFGVNNMGHPASDPASQAWFMPFNVTPPDLTTGGGGGGGGGPDRTQNSGSMMYGHGSFQGVPMEGLEGLETGPFNLGIMGVDMDGSSGLGHEQGQPRDG